MNVFGKKIKELREEHVDQDSVMRFGNCRLQPLT